MREMQIKCLNGDSFKEINVLNGYEGIDTGQSAGQVNRKIKNLIYCYDTFLRTIFGQGLR